MKRLLTYLSFTLFLLTGIMTYALVYDIEPISQEKSYCMERDIYNRSDESWNYDFPSFDEWVAENDRREARFYEWISSVGQEIGKEAAACFDPWASYQDTREGHAAAAPDNWAKGERD